MNSIKNIKITHIASGDIWAGAESQLVELCKAMKSTDLNITLSAILFNDAVLAEKLRDLDINVCICSEESLSLLNMINKAARFLKKNKTECIHTHGFKENIIGNLARLKASCPKSVATVHGNPETNTTWKQPIKKLTRLLDNAFTSLFQSKLVAVSGQLETNLKHIFPNKEIVKITNFVDVNKLKSYRNNGNGTNKIVKIGFVGRLIPLKRADLFIQTVELFTKHNPQQLIEAVIIGDGPQREGLSNSIKNKGLDTLISMKGFVDPVSPELAKLDILIMPSDHEGLPMTILEAMALGVVVVAHNVGGIPEVLNNGNAGILVDKHTPKGYEESLTALLHSKNMIESIRTKADKFINSNFDANEAVIKYADLYL